MTRNTVKILNKTDLETILGWYDVAFQKRGKESNQDYRTRTKILAMEVLRQEYLEQNNDFQRDWTE